MLSHHGAAALFLTLLFPTQGLRRTRRNAGKSVTCEAQVDSMACTAWGECYTCGARISYLVNTVGLSRAGAGQQVSDAFEEACGACGGSCFGEFSQVVSEQGGGVGGEIVAASDEACKVACQGDPSCKSFVYCPGFGKCWMKDRQLNGTESTGPQSDCRTYYETEFCSSTDGSAAESSPAQDAIAKPHSEAPATCEAQADNMACTAWGECYACGARISYLVNTVGLSRAGAGQQVSDAFEEACGACGGSCFGEFSQVVSEQGGGVGGEIVAASDEACKVACQGDPSCKSFVYCPGFGKCWMKDRQLNGTESTGPQSDCRTYYETEFCS